jgi:hypothetical protein
MAIDVQAEVEAIRASCKPGDQRLRAYVDLAQRLAALRSQATGLQVKGALGVLIHKIMTLANDERGPR